MRLILGLVAFLVAAVAAIAFAYPAAAAVACPSCYGFADMGGNLYLENSMTPQEREDAQAIVAQARDRVKTFYGALDGNPRILICKTDACYDPMGGKSHGIALLDKALFLSPRGENAVIAAHELSHIELHSRLGLEKTWNKAIPQWFDEGLAVNISNDPRYLKPEGTADRCILEPEANMPTTRNAWVESAQTRDLYAKAACKVSRWLAAHDGAQGVVKLAAEVAAGETFEAAGR
jgi:hypothetical protein